METEEEFISVDDENDLRCFIVTQMAEIYKKKTTNPIDKATSHTKSPVQPQFMYTVLRPSALPPLGYWIYP